MSRHRKGRRHRKVNMTPRPVGPRRSPRAVRERPVPRTTEVARAGAPAPAPGAPIPGQDSTGERAGVVSRKVSESGLSRHAVRTWERLAEAGSAGAEVGELSATVGFQCSTVLGHLRGLAELGLAEGDESVWRATGPLEDAAPREDVRTSAGAAS
ncbi:hypothetical protein AB0912_07320 [Streptomyces sp. NPDC007084]|uniref:hypothetical protein n=1 Tax=Streptomyces sp. NPDC007084 TaxID=3154313 RepID=UPI00345205FA